MLSEEYCPAHLITKLPKQIRLGSIEKPDVMRLTHQITLPVLRNGTRTLDTFAVAKLPPGPKVIFGRPWIELRCPEALASLKKYGGESIEKPIPSGPCKDPKIAYSMGGDFPHLKILMALEAEEERRTDEIMHAQAFIRAVAARTAALEDEGYFSEEDDHMRAFTISQDPAEGKPLPPIRGLKKNPEGWQDHIPSPFQAWFDIFEDVTPETPAVSIPGYNCEIKLKTDAVLKSQAPYQTSREELMVLDKILEERKRLGIIEESTADHAVPVFFVRDPPSEGRNDGQRQMRLVDDLRDLNANIQGMAYPIPRIEPMVNRLAAAKLLRSFDAKSGYDLVPVEEASRPLTTFTTKRGLFQWTRMPQGLKTAPAIFQRRMEHIFHHLIDREGCGIFVYIDDIFIYADTQEDLDKTTIATFEAARRGGLKLSPVKANWDAEELKCLGFTIKRGVGVFMNKDKIALIHESRPPTRVHDVQVLQGTINYYNRFIPHFADKSACITDLLKKGEPWEWTPHRQEAWELMCKWVRDDNYLQPWDYDVNPIAYTDASDAACGGLLMQPTKADPSQLGLCYCFHRKFHSTEVGWGIPDKELFSIIHLFREFWYLLMGKPVEIRTDHRNLAAFMFNGRMTGHDGRRSRWWEEIVRSGIDFTITPISGKDNELADFLSRFGYPDVAAMGGKSLLELERFSTKALTDIVGWFRKEQKNIRERMEEAFQRGDRKAGSHLSYVLSQVANKTEDIVSYLYPEEVSSAGLSQDEKLNDSGDECLPDAAVSAFSTGHTRMSAARRAEFESAWRLRHPAATVPAPKQEHLRAGEEVWGLGWPMEWR